MTKKTATKKDAAQTSDEAGATPPFDARCVTVPCGVAPASWRKRIAPMVWAASRIRVRKSTAGGGHTWHIVKKPPETVSRTMQARTTRKRTARRLRAVRRLHAPTTSRISRCGRRSRATRTTRSGRRVKTEQLLASAGHLPSSRESHHDSTDPPGRKTSSRARSPRSPGSCCTSAIPFPRKISSSNSSSSGRGLFSRG